MSPPLEQSDVLRRDARESPFVGRSKNFVPPRQSDKLPSGNVSEQAIERDFFEQPSDAAFDRLFAVWFPKLQRFFLVRGCDPATAEDLAQETLFTVYRHGAALRRLNLFRPWLIKVARNTLLQDLRRSGRRLAPLSLDYLDQVPEGWTQANTFRLLLADLLQTLSLDEQQIVLLRFVEELEYHEIAAALDVPLGTVKWRIHSTRSKLMAAVSERRRDEPRSLHLVPAPSR